MMVKKNSMASDICRNVRMHVTILSYFFCVLVQVHIVNANFFGLLSCEVPFCSSFMPAHGVEGQSLFL